MMAPIHLAFSFCILQKLSLLVVETNRYYRDYIDRIDNGPFSEPNVTEVEMFVFLALTIQMGHGVRDKLIDNWATVDQLYTPFCSTMMKWDRHLHILRYSHFTDNRNEPDRTDENFDRLWKILAIEVIVSFKGRVIIKQYIPKKYKCFGIKIFRLCDLTGYMYKGWIQSSGNTAVT